MEIGEKMKESLEKIIDGIGELSDAAIDEVLEVELQKLVDDTSTPFDNIAKDALYPVLEKLLKEKIKEGLGKIKEKI